MTSVIPLNFEPQISYRIDGNIARVDFNGPEDTGNVLDNDNIFYLGTVIRDLGERDDINAISIEGPGPSFCLGRKRLNMIDTVTAREYLKHVLDPITFAYTSVSAVPVPVIARVHGDAFGFGAAIAGACDVTVASSDASFRFSEAVGGPPTLAMGAIARRVSPAGLNYMFYSGSKIHSTQAQIWGLASVVYPAASFAVEYETFISTLSQLHRNTLTTMKRYQREVAYLPSTVASDYAAALFAIFRSGG